MLLSVDDGSHVWRQETLHLTGPAGDLLRLLVCDHFPTSVPILQVNETFKLLRTVHRPACEEFSLELLSSAEKSQWKVVTLSSVHYPEYLGDCF